MQRMLQSLVAGLTMCCVTFLLSPAPAAAQDTNTPMDAFIARQQQQHSFRPVNDLWTEDMQVNTTTADPYVSKAQFLQLNQARLGRFMTDKNKGIRLVLPDGDGQEIEIDLARFDILAQGFNVEEVANGVATNIAYTPGLYYRGVVRDIPGSLAAFSFFNNEVYGVFSIPGKGNFSIVPNTLVEGGTSRHYLLYNDNDLKIRPEAKPCRSDDLDVHKLMGDGNTASRFAYNNCKDVEIFLKADYATYLSRSSSTVNVTNYLTSIFNVLCVIYRNEGIYTSIKTVSVNTTTDDYQSLAQDSEVFLNKFGQLTQNSMGGADMAHLVSTRYGGSMGGVAWLDVLCDSYTYYAPLDYHIGPYAFSNIYANETAGTFPTYTWNVECMTHEMGHNLGSSHTHNCTAWTGGPIDGCAPTYNPGYAEGSCATGPIPSSAVKGTIMSYCHLLSGVGISFTNGFGTQPGNLIRTKVGSSTCATNYIPDTVLSVTNTTLNATRECTDATGLTFYWNDNDNSDESDNRVVLKLKKGTNNIGSLDDPGFAVSTATLAGYGSNTGTAVTFPAGTANVGSPNAAMNRYWNVTPVTQPATPVEVQFPFSQQDISDVAGSIPSVTGLSELRFYKMATGVNPNPAAGFAGATSVNTTVYTYSSTVAGANTWTPAISGNTRFARFLVSSFSGGGGFGTTTVPLPLNLISFKGVLKGDVIVLDWETAREKDIREYIVEHAVDAVHYQPVSIVRARNEQGGGYNTTDQHPAEGINYYRLSLVNNEGVRVIAGYTEVTVHQHNAVSIYPNPASDDIHVGITGDRTEAMTLRILDMQGRVVLSAILHHGDNSCSLKSLPKGMYMVQVFGSRETVSQKLMVR